MEEITSHAINILLVCSILAVITGEIVKKFRQPYGIKLCHAWCQGYTNSCVHASLDVESLTCCVRLREETKPPKFKICTAYEFTEGGKQRPWVIGHGIKLQVISYGFGRGYASFNSSCSKCSGRLAKIDSQEKQTLAGKLLKSDPSSMRTTAIGVYAVNGEWRYIDGTSLTFSFWQFSPYSVLGHAEIMGPDLNFTWTPIGTTSVIRGICEISN